MSRRIEIELTSERDDATFTWRAAGALKPRGIVAASTLPRGVSVGDVLRVELASGLDGTEITQVITERAPRTDPGRIELLGKTIADDELVTSRLAGRSKKPKGAGRNDRGRRERRDPEDRPASKGTGARDRRADRHPKSTTGPKKSPPRPRAPRLRAGQTHRRAYLETLPEEQQAVAQKLIQGGLPGLRKALDDDNAKRKAQGQPEIPVDGLITMAEKILPGLQKAEWHDRADAALAQVDTVDLRDLRSVVVAADDHAKTEETRALATDLRERLTERVDRAQQDWLAELQSDLDDKRLARALNASSRPPKAGSPLPQPLADRLVDATNAALSPESASERWVTLLDALALAPVRQRVVPTGIPETPSDELLSKVRKLAKQLPAVAAAFQISSEANATN